MQHASKKQEPHCNTIIDEIHNIDILGIPDEPFLEGGQHSNVSDIFAGISYNLMKDPLYRDTTITVVIDKYLQIR